MNATLIPTEQTYGELQAAYAHFNDALFGGQLPHALITLQREKHTYGYFKRERFVKEGGERVDEIAMNPAYFAVVPVMEVLQTVAHEMVHLWQAHFGKPGRRSYHNKEWADKMESIGLMPSDTGKPGGKRVGEKMADYAIDGGPFSTAAAALLETGFAITWKDLRPAKEQVASVLAGEVEGVDAEVLAALGIELPGEGEGPAQAAESKSNRRKFTCPKCEANAWGKPSLNLICGDCQVAFLDAGA